MLSFVAKARSSLSVSSIRTWTLNAPRNRPANRSQCAPSLLARFRPSNSIVNRFGCRTYSSMDPSDDMVNMPHINLDGERVEPELEAEHSSPPPSPPASPSAPSCTQHSAPPYVNSKPSYKNSFVPQRTRQDATPSESENNGHTFVSSYYRIDESVFAPYLTRKNLVFKQNASKQLVIRECPFCHDTKSNPTNLWKLYIYMENGHYFCFRCNAQGSWCVRIVLSLPLRFCNTSSSSQPSHTDAFPPFACVP